MNRWLVLALLLLIISIRCEGAWIRGAGLWDPEIRLPSEKEVWEEESEDEIGTRWAVLVAGSMGFGNYRHQVNILI
jgi:legumain